MKKLKKTLKSVYLALYSRYTQRIMHIIKIIPPLYATICFSQKPQTLVMRYLVFSLRRLTGGNFLHFPPFLSRWREF